jgi:excisionase family DNA binding protein
MKNTESSKIPVYLTLKQVAEFLKVKPRAIYAWVSEKRIPFQRKGGLLRFRLDQIVEWNEPSR